MDIILLENANRNMAFYVTLGTPFHLINNTMKWMGFA